MSDSEEQNIFVMERPMHLVKPERQHQGFSCIPEAIKVLKMLHKPVTVVSLVGSQRGGKSSLLNLLYDRNTGLKNGFGVGHECIFVLQSANRGIQRLLLGLYSLHEFGLVDHDYGGYHRRHQFRSPQLPPSGSRRIFGGGR